jgi:hypothetical protein
MACNVSTILKGLDNSELDRCIQNIKENPVNVKDSREILKEFGIADKSVYAAFSKNGLIQVVNLKNNSFVDGNYISCALFTSLDAYRLFSSQCVDKSDCNIQIVTLQTAWNQILHAKMSVSLDSPVYMRIITARGEVLGLPVVQ